MELSKHIEKLDEAAGEISKNGHLNEPGRANLWTAYQDMIEAIHNFRKVAERYNKEIKS